MAVPAENTEAFEIKPISGAMGGVVEGLRLSPNMGPARVEAIERAVAVHGALMFRDQDLTPESMVALARRFGAPEVHPVVNGTEALPELVVIHKPVGWPATFGHGWHSDNSFFEQPTGITLLYGLIVPAVGGDTLFQSTSAAYEALSDGMEAMLADLKAIHTGRHAFDPAGEAGNKYSGDAPMRFTYDPIVEEEVAHPVVRTHPLTGAKSLFINPLYTTRFADMTEGESRDLLDYLFEHIRKPEFGCRLDWQTRGLAIWDNRVVQHYALNDYIGQERLLHRITVKGERPY